MLGYLPISGLNVEDCEEDKEHERGTSWERENVEQPAVNR